MLRFYSIDSDNNEVKYFSPFVREKNTLIFEDKSVNNTKVFLTIGENIKIERHGNINMSFLFDLDNLTLGMYENELGLKAEFIIKTNELLVSNNNVIIAYDLYLDSEKISGHRIVIDFK